MGAICAAHSHAACGWLVVCTSVRGGHEVVNGSQINTTEDFRGILINVVVTESETDTKSASFVYREWVGKCDGFSWAKVVGFNTYFRFSVCYRSISALNGSFAFTIMYFVGDWVTPFHPQVVT